MLPLGADVEEGTVVVGIDDGNTHAKTQLEVLRAILSINIIIRCGVSRSHPVPDMMEGAARAARIGNPLCTDIELITVLEQSTAECVGIVFERREIEASPLLELEVCPYAQFLVMAVGHSHTKGGRDGKSIGNGKHRRVGLDDIHVRGDNPAVGVSVEFMSRAEHRPQGDVILRINGLGVLYAEVEFITADRSLIRLGEGVDIRRAHHDHPPVETAPEISRIESYGERLHQLEASAQEELVETTVAIISTGHLG